MGSGSLRMWLPQTLETDRLTLELYDYSPAHYELLIAVINTPSAYERMGDIGVRTAQQLDADLTPARLHPARIGGRTADVDIYYLARLKQADHDRQQQGRLLGGVSCTQRGATLPCDVGWAFLEDVHGKGYATEAARALMQMVYTHLQITDVMCMPRADNVPSCRVAEKASFVFLREVPGPGKNFKLYGSPERTFDADVVALATQSAEETEGQRQNYYTT